MKTKHFVIFIMLFTVLLTPLLAQEEMGDMDAQMKMWEEYKTPGDVHKMMASYAGEWKSEIKMWQYPGAEPTVNIGISVNEMLLDGRYLQATHKAEFMGMEMKGISIEGYDNHTKEFTSVWMDNFGTGTMIAHGKWDEETKAIHYKGVVVDPMSGEKVGFREVMYYIDNDTQKMEMFMDTPEGEFQTMEIMFTRVK